jgi:hypothetical protein
VFVFFAGVVSNEYLPTGIFVGEVDKLFDSFNSVRRAAPGKALRTPLSDNSPHIGQWTKASMGNVVTKWAMQCLAWGSTPHTVKAIEQFVHLSNKNTHRQVLIADDTCKKHKHLISSTQVSLSQLANLKNICTTKYPITLE